MADHNYEHGGWRDKYVIFTRCPDCGGTGEVPYPREDPQEQKLAKFKVRCDKCTDGLIPVDPNARKAALAYADSVEGVNPQFARDIRAKVETINCSLQSP